MKRKWIIMVGLAALLAACGGQAAAPTPTAVQVAPTPVPPTAAVAKVTAATPSGTPTSFELDPATMCTKESLPEPVPGIPPAGPDDWTEGAANATNVLIEYGDYQ